MSDKKKNLLNEEELDKVTGGVDSGANAETGFLNLNIIHFDDGLHSTSGSLNPTAPIAIPKDSDKNK